MERIVNYRVNEEHVSALKELGSLIEKKNDEWKNSLGKHNEFSSYEELKLLRKIHGFLNVISR